MPGQPHRRDHAASFSIPRASTCGSAGTDDNPSRTAHNWSVIGATQGERQRTDDVRAELDHIFGALKARLGKDIDAEGVTIRTMRESLTSKVRTLMYVLLGAVVLVLLVACTNLASANLARGEAQQREIAVRASLGASRATAGSPTRDGKGRAVHDRRSAGHHPLRGRSFASPSRSAPARCPRLRACPSTCA